MQENNRQKKTSAVKSTRVTKLSTVAQKMSQNEKYYKDYVTTIQEEKQEKQKQKNSQMVREESYFSFQILSDEEKQEDNAQSRYFPFNVQLKTNTYDQIAME